jgi:hypothetical protein
MEVFRRSRMIARLVLACFVLVLAGTGAFSLGASTSMQWVCTAGGGMKWVNVDPAGHDVPSPLSASSDCPLCSAGPPAALLPAPWIAFALPEARLDAAPDALHAAPVAKPPLPSTGPPLFA